MPFSDNIIEDSSNNYFHNGYFLGSSFLSEKSTLESRELFSILFDTYKQKLQQTQSFPRLQIDWLTNQKDLSVIINLLYSKKIIQALNSFSERYGSKVYVLPPFEIMKNYSNDRIKSGGIGWHRDADGELSDPITIELLQDPQFVLGKLGIYFQENNIFPGGIDVIPESQYLNKANSSLLKRLIPISKLRLLQKFHDLYPNLYVKINEKKYMKFINAKKISNNSGDFVLFDSRIFHRGSIGSEEVLKDVEFIDEHLCVLPEEKTKYVLYGLIASEIGLKAYIHDQHKRKEKGFDSTLEALNNCLELEPYGGSVNKHFDEAKELLSKHL